MPVVYKICPELDWTTAVTAGRYEGSPDDRRDGFIHLSAAHQLEGTLARHFAGQKGLLLVAFETQALGTALRWEPSRGGDLFPHVYSMLEPKAALWVKPLPLVNGSHLLPDLA